MTKTDVAVIGLGAMGAGIAEVFAKAGHHVVGIEYNDAALARGRELLTKSLDRAVTKEKLTAEQRDDILARFTWTTSTPDGVSKVGLIIEAVNENAELKERIFREVDQHAPEDALLATNTSSLSITRIAAATQRPQNVVGIHFFNPAQVQKLVEVIRTPGTSDATVEQVLEILSGIGKTAIVCGDRAGFIVNNLLLGYLNHAVRLYQDGFAERDEIERRMVDEAGYPMGPFSLLDMIGLDVCESALARMYEETGDRLHRPAALLTQLTAGGMLGSKTGRGFFAHHPEITEDDAPVTWAMTPTLTTREEEVSLTLIAPYLNNALSMVERRYATADDIDTGLSLGCRMPKPFDMIAKIGPVELLAAQREIFNESAEPGHRPSRLLERLAAAEDPAEALAALRS